MAFDGSWYIKVGNYPIPLEYMAYRTYKMSKNVQDLDSYRDADGVLHRNVLSHVVVKLEFETPILTEKQFRTLMTKLRENMPTQADKLARNVSVTYYDEETGFYETGDFYMPGTMEYTHFNKKIYEPTRIVFIEY